MTTADPFTPELSADWPRNAVTGTEYRGKNVARLTWAEIKHDYTPAPRPLPGSWAGFKQWRSIGRTVRRGEHGTACLTVVETTDGRKPRGFTVFHYDQTDALPDA